MYSSNVNISKINTDDLAKRNLFDNSILIASIIYIKNLENFLMSVIWSSWHFYLKIFCVSDFIFLTLALVIVNVVQVNFSYSLVLMFFLSFFSILVWFDSELCYSFWWKNATKSIFNPLRANSTKWSKTLKRMWVCLTILWGWCLKG